MADDGKNTGGLMSSAGLVRYFDEESNRSIKIDPKTVFSFGVLFGAFILGLNMLL